MCALRKRDWKDIRQNISNGYLLWMVGLCIFCVTSTFILKILFGLLLFIYLLFFILLFIYYYFIIIIIIIYYCKKKSIYISFSCSYNSFPLGEKVSSHSQI